MNAPIAKCTKQAKSPVRNATNRSLVYPDPQPVSESTETGCLAVNAFIAFMKALVSGADPEIVVDKLRRSRRRIEAGWSRGANLLILQRVPNISVTVRKVNTLRRSPIWEITTFGVALHLARGARAYPMISMLRQ